MILWLKGVSSYCSSVTELNSIIPNKITLYHYYNILDRVNAQTDELKPKTERGRGWEEGAREEGRKWEKEKLCLARYVSLLMVPVYYELTVLLMSIMCETVQWEKLVLYLMSHYCLDSGRG